MRSAILPRPWMLKGRPMHPPSMQGACARAHFSPVVPCNRSPPLARPALRLRELPPTARGQRKLAARVASQGQAYAPTHNALHMQTHASLTCGSLAAKAPTPTTSQTTQVPSPAPHPTTTHLLAQHTRNQAHTCTRTAATHATTNNRPDTPRVPAHCSRDTSQPLATPCHHTTHQTSTPNHAHAQAPANPTHSHPTPKHMHNPSQSHTRHTTTKHNPHQPELTLSPTHRSHPITTSTHPPTPHPPIPAAHLAHPHQATTPPPPRGRPGVRLRVRTRACTCGNM